MRSGSAGHVVGRKGVSLGECGMGGMRIGVGSRERGVGGDGGGVGCRESGRERGAHVVVDGIGRGESRVGSREGGARAVMRGRKSGVMGGEGGVGDSQSGPGIVRGSPGIVRVEGRQGGGEDGMRRAGIGGALDGAQQVPAFDFVHALTAAFLSTAPVATSRSAAAPVSRASRTAS